MTTDSAPERIIATRWFGVNDFRSNIACTGDGPEVFPETQYARTDIAEAEKEAAVLAERDRLLKAARELKARDLHEVGEAGSDYCAGVNDVVRALETAIRKGDENG